MGEARKRAKAQKQHSAATAEHLQLHVCTHKKVSSQLPVKKKNPSSSTNLATTSPPHPHPTTHIGTRHAGRHTPKQRRCARRRRRRPSPACLLPSPLRRRSRGQHGRRHLSPPPNRRRTGTARAQGTPGGRARRPRPRPLPRHGSSSSYSRRTGPRNQGSARRPRPTPPLGSDSAPI